MMYYISGEQYQAVKQVMKALGINSIPSIKNLDPDEVLENISLCRQTGLDAELQLQIVEVRVKKLVDEYNELDDAYQFERLEKQGQMQDMEVFSGYYCYALLERHMFDFDYASFGFTSFEDFISIVGAVVCNYQNRDFNESEFSWETAIGDQVFQNGYCRETHGDFRFIQYDVTPREQTSVFGDVTRLFRPQYNKIYAYHSVEISWFATLLRYSIETQTPARCLEHYSEFCNELLDGKPVSDWRNRFDYMSEYLLEAPIADIQESMSQHVLHKEYDGYVRMHLDGDQLVMLPAGVRFCPNDLEYLIKGLHLACRDGFGRTVIEGLIAFYTEQQSNYLTLFNEFTKATHDEK